MNQKDKLLSEEGEILSDTQTAAAGKYLTFELKNEVYGIEILQVQEIIGIVNVTQIPKTPEYIRGVINLRGNIIPVMDLRVKFQIPSQKDTEKTCIIVLNLWVHSKKLIFGIIVDHVSEVLDMEEEMLAPPPSFGESIHLDFVKGIGKIKKKVIILLNIKKIMPLNDVMSVQKLQTEIKEGK